MVNWHEANREFNHFLVELFNAEKWQDRANAARELGMMKDGRATNLLCRSLGKETDPQVINSIIQALGRIGDVKATIPIINKLKEELDKFEGDKFKLIYIIEALKNIKDKRALPYLSMFLNSPDDDLKHLTIETFDAILPNWREIIKKKEKRTVREIFEPEKKPDFNFRHF